MTKNTLITRRSLIHAALLSAPLTAHLTRASFADDSSPRYAAQPAYTLPPLSYSADALEPYLDRATMQRHREQHAFYIARLNTAVESVPHLASQSPEALVTLPNELRLDPMHASIQKCASGHVNHSLFWATMATCSGGAPEGPLREAIQAAFGSFEHFQVAFLDAGIRQTGRGWVWLARDGAGRLQIVATPNEDNPMMPEYGGLYPILGSDLWEHAYASRYRTDRAAYIRAWWNVVNWDAVATRFIAA